MKSQSVPPIQGMVYHPVINVAPSSLYIQVRAGNTCGRPGWKGKWFPVISAPTPSSSGYIPPSNNGGGETGYNYSHGIADP